MKGIVASLGALMILLGATPANTSSSNGAKAIAAGKASASRSTVAKRDAEKKRATDKKGCSPSSKEESNKGSAARTQSPGKEAPKVKEFMRGPRKPSANPSRLSFKIGGAQFIPFGFMDLTGVYRSTNVGSGIGTSFGSIPFNGASPAGRLSETRFSAQNSRVGLKVESDPSDDLKITGYLEADFVGNSPSNLEVTSHSDTLRMRLYWVDVQRGKWEFLGGQSWSMMTPNRRGISAMPEDIFYTQDMDTNYQVGLVWLRTPGFRIVYHANRNWTLGFALEDPEQFTGGLVVFPAGFNVTQVDDAGGNAKTPNAAPDLMAKIAYDGKFKSHAFHVEAAGLYRIFRLNTAATNVNVTKSGGGVSVNANFEAIRKLRLVGTSFWSDGGGRYIFGLGPDFVVKTDPSGNFVPSPLHAGAGIGGFEYRFLPQTMLYGYYGSAYFGRNFQTVTSGGTTATFGYGYAGSGSSQNRTIQEATFGVIQTLWKNRNYGDIKIITQGSYLSRNPWSTTTTPANARSAHLVMAFVNLRYDLP